MTDYSQAQRDEDGASVKNAMQHIDSIRKTFGDVLVIPEIITIQDVCEMMLDTTKGPQKIGDHCSRAEIVAVLHALEENPCGDPHLVANYALSDYRQTQPSTKE
jgi:hypothetical protein